MSTGNSEVVEALRATLKERDRLRRENTRLRASASEPIAVVGMACRYPGGIASPEDLWRLVAAGGDAIGEFPADRGWDTERLFNSEPGVPGTTYTREGGFMAEAGGFDADFFSISPREALIMDPQERQLLESCWQALEDAGIDPASLQKSQTGVFAGVGDRDYGTTPGTTASVVSGRVSYALGLEGPAISIDTGCSSSLVAMHLAAQALRQGECTLALAGGVAILSTPWPFIFFSAQGGLAPDGRCKSFADAADGTTWAEGVGVLVLERLSDARRSGRPVLALLRGSAINQDGASNGLTAPNGPSQERVIRQALASAGLEPQDVDVVEAHGTGTTLGDPIEASALLAAYGQEREQPLRLGSLKSNIGHAQAAAGVAGVIKMIQAMRAGVMPKTMHVDAPSSKVDWEAGKVELLREQLPWEEKDRPRRAGVSSFGIGGTNAHVIVEEAPEPEAAPATVPLGASIPLVLSAKTEIALAEAAECLAAHLREDPSLDPTDVAHSLATTRSVFDHRAVVLGADRDELLESLEAVAANASSSSVLTARAGHGKLAYLFTGQGSQRLGMGKGLYGSDPVFQAAFDTACEQLDPHLEKSLKEIVFAEDAEAAGSLEDTTYAQPALFALEVALHEALSERGLSPDLLAGHSVGEIAAIHVAGVLDLADAAKLVAARGRLMGALPHGGAMAAIEATEEEVSESIEGREAELAIAAINGPASTVISGAENAVEAVRSGWEGKGRKTKRLAVSHAFHSPLMEPMLAEFKGVAESLGFQEPKLPVLSNVSGELFTAEQATDPAYWVAHARRPVRFADAVSTLRGQGATSFLELGPDPVLCAMARECLGEDSAAFVPTLREGRAESESISTAIATAHAAGARVDWSAFFAGTNAKFVPLPTYPFQHRHYWLDSAVDTADATKIGQVAAGHPMLAAAVEDPSGGGVALTGRLSRQTHPWLGDHMVGGAVVLPGTAFLELALRAAREVGATVVEELTLQVPLAFPELEAVAIQVSVSSQGEDSRREISIHSRLDGAEGEWTQNAGGVLSEQGEIAAERIDAWPPEGAEPLQVEYLYDVFAERGFQYGPAFQGLTAAWKDSEQIYAEVSLSEEHSHEAERFGVHPALFDSALHGIAFARAEGDGAMRLPFSWSGVRLAAEGANELRVRIAPGADGDVSLSLADGQGNPVARVEALAMRLPDSSHLRPGGSAADGLMSIQWVEAQLAEQGETPDDVEVLRCEIDGEVGRAAAALTATQGALEAIQEWLNDESSAGVRLVLLTQGAISTGNEPPAPAAAAIWGLVRSAQSEHPGRFALIDTDPSEASKEALAAALALSAEEPQLALREGAALVPRLTRAKVESEDEPSSPAIDPQRTTLITGATGGLGALTARHLAEHHGARHLLLVSRSGPGAEGAADLQAELEGLGADARIVACDVSDRSSLEVLLASISAERPLGAVIHCAGVLADATVEALTPEQVGRVFAAKVEAASNLHDLTADLGLSAFVLFSSVAGTLGGPGQGNYAAANVFLDALAQSRQAEGLAGTSIAWGLWESGMVAGLGEADRARVRRAGIEALADERGLALFDAAVDAGHAQTLALALDTAALRGAASVGALPPIFSLLVHAPRRRSAISDSLAARLAALPEGEAGSFVLELVRTEVAAVLGHASGQEIEPARAFQDLGFDSLAAVELRNRLSAISGLPLPATVVFDYPSSAALAERLLSEASENGAAKKAAIRVKASDEPIAIVGMACRYPGGVESPEDLWRLVAEGREGTSTFPADRGWDVERIYDPDPDNPGTSYTREGGFVGDVAGFDPAFFGISPREALITDPQQRLLLEVAWEAFEDARIDPATLRGSDAGVFAGVMYQDYGLVPGMSTSIVSGRIAYTLGLEGPAITIDTACSSSLVALHLAAQALRQGECSLALAGGVTVLATPTAFIDLSRQSALAPDGRSKSFAEAANGAGFAEGVGVLALERLSEAKAAGRPILAVLRGSAVNQDGASNGLTAPNGPSQERVIRQALANARLEPRDVDAIEAHGTGTTLGDPIEAGALLATYGQDRETPLKLGSIKSNIGHTQAAAGVAGVIKMTRAMQEGVLPKTLHVDAPSSKVDWEAGEIELITEQAPWERNGRPRRAGVSSFGVSGTNAHVILEEAPPAPASIETGEDGVEGDARPSRSPFGQVLLPLSAKAQPALAEAAKRLWTHLQDSPDLEPTDVAYSLATTRTAFERRAVAVGKDRDELLASLAAIAKGEPGEGIAHGAARTQHRPVFLYPGQGSQWEGMALDLIEASPVFAAKLGECEEALSPHIDWSVEDVLRGTQGAPSMKRIEVVQPTLFAVMASLTELWRSCGVHPAAVAGHSQGEIVAAYAAGGLSLEDAAMLAARRSQIISKLAGKGSLVSVAMAATELDSLLEPWGDRIEIAAHNGPTSTILSGDREALDRLLEHCAKEEVRAREVPAAIASHSAYVEELRDEVLDTLAPISPQSGEIAFHSTVTGGLLDTAELDAAYWYRNLRETVRFEQVTHGLIEQGNRVFIEVSPHPVFALAVGETIEAALPDPTEATALGTLRRDEDGPQRFSLSLAQAHAAGAQLDWEAYFEGSGAKAVKLPTYPFQRERYWIEAPKGGGDIGAAGLLSADHPLLGAALEPAGEPGEELLLTGRLSLATHPWLADHAVGGTALLPASAFLELALKAGADVGTDCVEELTMLAPLVLPENGAVNLQIAVGGSGEDGRREISMHSRPEGAEGAWTENASGTVAERIEADATRLDTWPPEGVEPLDTTYVYDRLAELGLEYGPAFQGLTAAWRDGDRVYAEVSLPDQVAHEAHRFAIHPVLFDSALQGAMLARFDEQAGQGPGFPFAWRGVSLGAVDASELRVCLTTGDEAFSLQMADGQGAPVATVDSLIFRALDSSQLRARPSGGLLGIEWAELVPEKREETAPEAELWHWQAEGDAAAGADAARRATRGALERIQRWLGDESTAGARLALVTRGAMATAADESPDPAAAAVWGLVRSAQSEHPGRFALIDSDDSEASEAALSTALDLAAEEPQLALREGAVLAPRLTRPAVAEQEEVRGLDPERTVLITGPADGTGARAARHLVERHGARHLLLIAGDAAEQEGAARLKAELEELGAQVGLAVCDLADRDALKAVLDSIPAEHPLGAVIHCAAVLADGMVESLTGEQIDLVFGPKAQGAWNLHELCAGEDLSAFVLFSSMVGALGSPGQGNYAAANSFLDALAQLRRARGQRANAIAWGLWGHQTDGAAGLREADVARIRRGGIDVLSEEHGLALLDEALAADRPLALAMALDSGSLRSLASAGALPPIYRGLIRTRARRSAASGSLAAKLASLPEPEREAHVLDLVRGEVAAVLGHASGHDVDPGRAFQELGFESLTAVELRNRLSSLTGLRLPATIVFDYPSATALAEHLLAEATASGPTQQVVVRAQTSNEPIAIVGMACRYPGGIASPEELWQLVAEGRDGIGEFPDDRGWDVEGLYNPDPANPGTSYTREGGFLADAGEFDAGFFAISPREALFMDPQERLLLESCWEALEDTGIDPVSLRKSATGVFAGVAYQDYGMPLVMSSSVVSGRVSYALGLEGPAITVNTACSSSLVAMHLAAQALRTGECSLALAGGVTVLSTPGVFIDFSRQRGLAPDGRCKSFADAADGAGFSDGVGVLALERLADAERAGHPIYALLRGSAVNQDGASNGLTAPNGPSQERVIRQALANAGLTPKDVDVVEAHGTGTTLGDPIEAGALLATYGQDRETPLKLGSLKSNIGHTQAAAGVAGVIKMALAMRAGVMPKSLHIDAPSSKVDWEAGEIELLTEQTPWQANGQPRRAGVSSFGVSGTNAHLILEEPPTVEPAVEETSRNGDGGEATATESLPGQTPLPLSAKAEPALAQAAERLATHLADHPELDPKDVAYSLATTRSAFEHRAVVLDADREGLLSALSALAKGEEHEAIARGNARQAHQPVFLFPGQGAQAQGMAMGLIKSSPAFANHIAACEAALAPHVEWSLTEVLAEEEAKWLDRLDIVQPALFAVMVSLAKLWRECGVEPSAVIGHSQGEIAAAHVAGALSLEDAALIIAKRGKAMAKIAGKGGMLSVSLTPEQLTPHIEPFGERVSLAAINGPASLVLSGDPDALAEIKAAGEKDGIRVQAIAVDYAAHSSQIEDLRDELLEAFAPITPQSSQVPLHSTVIGEQIDTQEMGPEYWYRNLRQTVLLEPVLRSLLSSGRRALIEIGPHPVLAFGVQETIEDTLEDPSEAILLSTLRREEDEPERFALSLAEAHANGVPVEWRAFFAGSGAKRVPLPTYPFQRERYWLDSLLGPAAGQGTAGQGTGHPLLGAAVPLAAGRGEGLLLSGRVSSAAHPWLAQHTAAGRVLMPPGAFLELALAAGAQSGAQTLRELTLKEPLPFFGEDSVSLQVTLGDPDEKGQREIWIHSRPEDAEAEEGQWRCHAVGVLAAEPQAIPEPLGSWPPQGADPLQVESLYDRLEEAGLEHGPALATLTAAWKQGERLYAEAVLPEEAAHEAGRFSVHPALLETVTLLACQSADETAAELPFSWRETTLHDIGASSLRICWEPSGDAHALRAYDQAGAPLLSAASIETRPLELGDLRSAQKRRHLHRMGWQVVPLMQTEEPSAEIAEIFPPEGAVPQAAQICAEQALAKLQEWVMDESDEGRRLTLLTHGAIAATPGEAPDLRAAGVWGMVRSAISAHPGRFALIDTDDTDASKAALPAALAAGAGEPQLALREGEALVPRLARLDGENVETAREPWDRDATVLIAGEDGLARSLAAHFAETHDSGQVQLASSSELADREALGRLLGSIPPDRPLGAVVYIPDVLDEDLFAAAWNLHELTAEPAPSRFLLVSSEAGILGGIGQARSAASSAFLDALAGHRQTQGLAATSLAWGARSEDGDLELVDAALESGEPLLAPVRFSSAELRAQAADGILPAVLRGLIKGGPVRRPDALARRLTALQGDEREAAVLDLIRTQIAKILAHSGPAAVDPDRPFIELGVDSVSAMELRNRFGAAIGVQIPISVLAAQPTIRELAGFAAQKLDPSAASGEEPGRPSETFVSLLAQARDAGRLGEFMRLLTDAAEFRTSFDRPLDAEQSPTPVRLADGVDSPSLVLLPSLVATSGPQEYVRFANGLGGQHSALAVPLPGFALDEPLPNDLEVFARSMAEAILGAGVDSELALAGYSSGGWVAHLVAAQLESLGASPTAVLLIDTPATSVGAAELLAIMPALDADSSDRLFIQPDDTRLSAMAHYFHLFGEWAPSDLSAPVLMVRADESLAAIDAQIDRLERKLEPRDTMAVPGNHFTMMWEHAETTAQAVLGLLAPQAKTP